MKILKKLAIPILSTFLAVAPLKAERISGHIDHVNTFESVPESTVNAEGLGQNTSDENGNYVIDSDAVIIDPSYNLPIQLTDNNKLYNIQGRRITNLDKNNIESRLLPSHVNLPSGKYFIQTESGLTIPFVNLDKTRTLPNIIKERQRLEDNIKRNSNRTSAIRNLTVTGEGFHNFSRMINIGDDTRYDFFMVPVDSAESEYFDTILDVYKALCTGWRPKVPIIRNPRDLPLSIYNQDIPEPNDSVNYLDGVLASIEDTENNGRNNWFNSEFVDAPLDSGEAGINIIYTNDVPGGGVGWTEIVGSYNDEDYVGIPYRWNVYILYNFRSQGTVNAVIRRELARTLGLNDRSPDRGYIMLENGILTDHFHSDELKTLDMHHDIIQRDYGRFNRPDMDWYLTDN